jgi:hypothetical protein
MSGTYKKPGKNLARHLAQEEALVKKGTEE